MGRSIPGGSRVLLEGAESPQRGEVWAFCDHGGAIVVHRCRGAAREGFRFQGDACVHADRPVSAERLIGRVTEVGPGRPRWRWNPWAGAMQRTPRMVVAAGTRWARRRTGSR